MKLLRCFAKKNTKSINYAEEYYKFNKQPKIDTQQTTINNYKTANPPATPICGSIRSATTTPCSYPTPPTATPSSTTARSCSTSTPPTLHTPSGTSSSQVQSSPGNPQPLLFPHISDDLRRDRLQHRELPPD